ncbi:hypothetical protein [Thiothrix unzii]|uniref:Uncharacterized protein n=1 Tax=Thiothrix unzii TaxID=111769 RepID=A0A975F6D5_9GAMM|nr:hypothetical protein [Thiothrix unzii]QTR52007.1 hypothetical protein J9260_09590 [Thiothrix unzii]
MTTQQQKIDNVFKQVILGIEDELKAIYKKEYAIPYTNALELIIEVKVKINEILEAMRNAKKNISTSKAIEKEYTKIKDDYDKIMPKIKKLLQLESAKINELAKSLQIREAAFPNDFLGDSLLIKSLELNRATLESTVLQIDDSRAITQIYIDLCDLCIDQYIKNTLGLEHKAKIKREVKDAGVIMTNILGMAPIIGLPFSLINLLMAIAELNQSILKKPQERADQLEFLTELSKLWNKVFTELGQLVVDHLHIVDDQHINLNDAKNTLFSDYQYWKNRLNTGRN